jgi:hypothetical protein
VSGDALDALTGADGPAAPPRSNGELVFAAPWESRAFGVAIALHDAGAIDYAGPDDTGYYGRWLAALEELLLEHRVVSAAELDERAAVIAHAWAHDHDH